MSIASEILRLQNAKDALKSAIENKGVTVPSNALLDAYDDYVAEIGNQSLIDLIERDITSIEIPSGVTTIGDYAFQGCTSLTSVTVPATVTDLGDNCFYNCTSLNKILMLPTTPPTEGLDWATNTNNCPIYVPDESLTDYQTTWSTLASRIKALSSQPLVYDFTNGTASWEEIPVDSTKSRNVYYYDRSAVLTGWMTTEYDGLYITGQYASSPYFGKRKVTDDVGLYNSTSQQRGLSIDCKGYNTIKIYNGNNLVDWNNVTIPYKKNCTIERSNTKTVTFKVNKGFEDQHIDFGVIRNITISRIELYNS